MKSMHKKRKIDAVIFHVVACVIGFFMIYPMLWLLASSFKSNETPRPRPELAPVTIKICSLLKLIINVFPRKFN